MKTYARELLPSDVCPHLALDATGEHMVCRQCRTPWAVVRAADRSETPDLFGGGVR